MATDIESFTDKLTDLEEEYGGDDDVFSGFDKINAASVKERIKEIGKDANAADELAVLKQWLVLAADEAALKKKLKEAEAELDAKAYTQYPKLSESEIQTLAVDDKWLAALDAAIHSEMDRVSQVLTQRVKELAERYEATLPQMANRVNELETKVAAHLQKMGFTWR